jgi:uncharacterized protein
MKFYATEQLGEHQSFTPEGFLTIVDVPIARIGTMIYGANEVPVEANKDGLIRIIREEDEVFRPEHIASYAGKPVVNDHPQENVTPANWRELAVGTVMHPRRGTGIQADLIIADFIITSQEAIDAIRKDGKVEVSCGYDADYVEIGVGEGRQVNLIGNHVALVEAGRCGPRCAINDHSTGDDTMRTHDEQTVGFAQRMGLFLDSIRAAVKAKDNTKLEKLLDEAPSVATHDDEGGPHIHIHGASSESEAGPNFLHDAKRMSDEELNEKFEKQEKKHAEDWKKVMDGIEEIRKHIGMAQDVAGETEEEKKKRLEKEKEDKEDGKELEEEAPPGTGDRARKAQDSMFLEESYQRTVSAAEVLAPGMQLPAFDRASAPTATLDSINKVRRTALELAYMTAESRGLIDQLLGGKPLVLDGMKAKDMKMLFVAATAAKKAINNQQGKRTGDVIIAGSGGGVGVRSNIKTPADLNKAWADKYKPAA